MSLLFAVYFSTALWENCCNLFNAHSFALTSSLYHSLSLFICKFSSLSLVALFHLSLLHCLARSLSVSCSSLYFLLHRFYTLSLQLVLLLLPFLRFALCSASPLLPLSLPCSVSCCICCCWRSVYCLLALLRQAGVAWQTTMANCICWICVCVSVSVCVSTILAPIRYRYIYYRPLHSCCSCPIPFVCPTTPRHT